VTGNSGSAETSSLKSRFSCQAFRLQFCTKAISILPAQTLPGQGQHHRLGKNQASGSLDILPHPGRVNVPVGNDVGHLFQKIIGQDERIGENNPFSRRVRNVSFMPERYVFQSHLQVTANNPGQPGHPFAAHRVSLVRHGRRTFLAPAERLFNFQNFGFLEMPDFQGKLFQARSQSEPGSS